jgi:hypothetical protein
MSTIGLFFARRCEHCPLCRYAREKPETLVGKMMAFHGKFCPFWRAWESEYRQKQESPKAPPATGG